MTSDPIRKRAAWKTGDKLTWSGERWTFWQFDPDYPRAICQSESLRVCAIDITTAKRVDPATERKRAERLRRKEAGEVRVEVILPIDALADLEALKGRWSMQSRSEVVIHAMRVALRENDVEITSSNNEVIITDANLRFTDANLRWIRGL